MSRKRLSSRGLRPLRAVEKGGDAGEKNEDRRAEVRDPARQEQRGVGDVARVDAAGAEEVARVVERHQHHDEAAQQIDRDDAGRLRGASRAAALEASDGRTGSAATGRG